MTLTLYGRIGILWFVARAWPLTMVCAYRQGTVMISKSVCVWEPGTVIYIYICILVCSTYVCLWRHVVSGSTPHPPCHQGQSVLRRTKALCRKCIRRFSCYLLCLPVWVFKCVITIYSENVMNQTLVVNELTRVFYDSAYYEVWSVLSLWLSLM